MTHSDANDTSGVTEQSRRARVVVLGEFSAGKSTLINLFTGNAKLRTQVTATQMPPVWMSHGESDPYRVALDGSEHPVDPSDPDSISVSDTLYVRMFMQTPLLEMFDLIDTPGNSDPNIASAAWERAAELADIAIWCSSSTQAWRQSELAAWRDVPEAVRARSILLLTRADKLTSDHDREKVLNRVKREAGDLFTHIHMASLLELENTRDVLADLVAMADSLAATNQATTSAPTHNAADLLDNLSEDHASEAPKLVADTETPMAEDKVSAPAADTGEMTDDMLIDSLDLSGEANLDELALSEDHDTDMDEVLAALTAAAPVAAVAATSTAMAQEETDAPQITEPAAAEVFEMPVAEGFASELWQTMSATIPHDDLDAYEAAFDLFLEKVDTEIATLRGQLNMKAVG